MEEALLKTKDKMMENLATLMERGEKIEALQAKTAELKVVSSNLKKKAKKRMVGVPEDFAHREAACLEELLIRQRLQKQHIKWIKLQNDL